MSASAGTFGTSHERLSQAERESEREITLHPAFNPSGLFSSTTWHKICAGFFFSANYKQQKIDSAKTKCRGKAIDSNRAISPKQRKWVIREIAKYVASGLRSNSSAAASFCMGHSMITVVIFGINTTSDIRKISVQVPTSLCMYF